MKTEIKKGNLSGTVCAVPSKAYAHRILICAALSDGPTEITGLFPSEDILATVSCLRACGAEITENNGVTLVIPPKEYRENALLDCSESGSTLRFLLPVAAALGINAEFHGHGRLPERPISELLDILKKGGVTADSDRLPLSLKGKLSGSDFVVDGSASSQFVTGMLLAVAAKGGGKLTVKGKKVSGSYIDITIGVMEKFGAKIIRDNDGYTVICPKRLVSPKKINVEGDWSNAAFWLVAGVVGKYPICVKNLDMNSLQGDRKIVDYLKKMNAEIGTDGDAVTAFPSVLHGAELDCSDCPDLIPILSVAAALSDGTTAISGAERLKIKECDRLQAMLIMLKSAGIACHADGDKLIIEGGKPSYFDGKGFADHRIIMSAAIFGLQNGCSIDDINGVKKSYPHFFEDFEKLGGKYGFTV